MINPKLTQLKFFLVFIVVLSAFSAAAQKKVKNDSLIIQDSIREMMFHGALLSMDALQAKYESQKTTEPGVKRQKSGEAQNLFFQSRAYYRRAIGFNKNYSPAWNSMGTTYYLQEIPKAAIPCYRKAISINENYSSAWFNLGKAYVALAMTDSAKYSYKQSIRSDSTFVQAYQELSRLIMANEKDSSQALNLLRLASKYTPTSEVPWVSMSIIYFSYQDSVNAIYALERAAQIYPGDAQRLQLLADYFQNHNPKKGAYYLNLLAVERKKMEIPADTEK
jgi:tetratricopeptide (TPR) repeat protein